LELRDENARYRAYLEQRKLDEKRQQIELDRIIQAELDKQNEKRLEKVRAEKDKRTKLLHEVIEGRQQQMIERSTIYFS
jgi:DNA anti-recombination protein RmuC